MDNAPKTGQTLPPLPLVVVATAIVAFSPSLAAWGLRAAGLLAALPAILLAALLSLALSLIGEWYWQRRPQSSDALFGDLMIWSWARRWRTERRLNAAVALLDLAPGGSIRSSIDLSDRRRVQLFRQLAADLEAVDPYTHGHSRRVARYATLMAAEMGLAPKERDQLRMAALLHDVGKLYTPKEILHKPGRLSEEEYATVKRHSVDGARMIRLLLGDEQLASVVLHHHERIDGSGYPSGLRGDLIPLAARIIAVADTFDAITSRRPYRPAMAHKVALEILRREAGSQLDPEVVRAFTVAYRGEKRMAAAAGASATIEAFVPALGAGVRLAGIAAGSTALAAGGLALPSGAHMKTASALLSPSGSAHSAAVPRLNPRTTYVTVIPPHTTRVRVRPGSHGGARVGGAPAHATQSGPTATTGGQPPNRGTGGHSPPAGARSPNPPQPSGDSPSPPKGGGGGGGVTVTHTGSGAGATINVAGTAASVTGSLNTNSPGAGVTASAAGGGSTAGVTVAGATAGGTTVNVNATPPGVP